MARAINQDDTYREKLLKLIPSEIVAAYLVLQGLMADLEKTVLWVVIVIMFILTYFYLKRFGNVKDTTQLFFSTLSFPIWVYSTGSKQLFEFYEPRIASIVLVIWTLVIPLVITRSPEPEPDSPLRQ